MFSPAILKDEGKKGHRQDFSSLAHLIWHADQVKPTKTIRASRNTDAHYADWCGTKDFPDCVKLATGGWEEGREQVQKYSAMFYEKISRLVFKPRIEFDVEGLQWDMARVLEGEPEAAMKFTQPNKGRIIRGKGKKVIRIVSSVDASGYINKSVVLRRGAAIAALAHALELSGRRCEIVAVLGSRAYDSSAKILQNAILVKKAENKMNLDAIAYALGHVSVLRRLCFATWETIPSAIQRLYGMQGFSYGVPAEPDVEGDIKLSMADYRSAHWRSDDATMKWALEELRKQGVQVTGYTANSTSTINPKAWA